MFVISLKILNFGIKNPNLLRLGIKNKRIYFILLSTFRNFVAHKYYQEHKEKKNYFTQKAQKTQKSA